MFGGIDGRLYFHIPGEPPLQSMTIEVKGRTHVRIARARATRGVLEADDAQMAGLILMRPRSAGQTRHFERDNGRRWRAPCGWHRLYRATDHENKLSWPPNYFHPHCTLVHYPPLILTSLTLSP